MIFLKDFQIDGHASFQFGCIGIVFSKYDFFIENGGKHVLLLYCLILDRNEKKKINDIKAMFVLPENIFWLFWKRKYFQVFGCVSKNLQTISITWLHFWKCYGKHIFSTTYSTFSYLRNTHMRSYAHTHIHNKKGRSLASNRQLETGGLSWGWVILVLSLPIKKKILVLSEFSASLSFVFISWPIL